jgi:hypothetical protein
LGLNRGLGVVQRPDLPAFIAQIPLRHAVFSFYIVWRKASLRVKFRIFV